MTRMIPETIHSSIQSPAEHRLFQTIRDAPNTATWVCLHSLSLAHHATKRRAEIDFVLLTHHGIFTLEVKGGRLKRRRGIWYSVDKHDATPPTPRKPLRPGRERHVRPPKANPRTTSRTAPKPTPSSATASSPPTSSSTSTPPSPIAASSMTPATPSTPSRATSTASPSTPAPPRPATSAPRSSPTPSTRSPTTSEATSTSSPPPDAVLDDVRKQLDQLTQEQRIALDVLDDSERVIVDGGAGTGKTLLAIEAAQRMARDGKRVLFVCFNKLLAARIHARIATKQYEGELVVRNLHRHFFEALEGSPFAAELEQKIKRNEEGVFDRLLPERAALVASERPDARFDALVIDEAQDILTTPNLDALHEMLRGGLDHGRWCVFLDSQYQASVYKKIEEAALRRLRQHGVRERLTLNCRNTRPIAFQTAVVSSARRRIKARVDGKPVRFTQYRKAPGWVSPLERVVEDLRREQVPPGSISVLLTKKPSDDEQKALQRLGLVQLTEEHVPALGTSTLTEITWSTVSGFKGLENDVVVLVGVKDIDDDWHQGIAYVGMSRARTGLHVIIREDCDEKRRERERELAEGRGSDVEMLL